MWTVSVGLAIALAAHGPATPTGTDQSILSALSVTATADTGDKKPAKAGKPKDTKPKAEPRPQRSGEPRLERRKPKDGDKAAKEPSKDRKKKASDKPRDPPNPSS